MVMEIGRCLTKVILRDNHPYKYGYGKLLHSGYHFVDLISIFLRANKNAGLNFEFPGIESIGLFN